jgi:hypothetical protein
MGLDGSLPAAVLGGTIGAAGMGTGKRFQAVSWSSPYGM